MNFKVYGTQILLIFYCFFDSITQYTWSSFDVLGRDLLKETVQKDVAKNLYLPTFQQQEQLISKSPNYDKLHNVRMAMDYVGKKLCQTQDCDRPARDEQICFTYAGHHI